MLSMSPPAPGGVNVRNRSGGSRPSTCNSSRERTLAWDSLGEVPRDRRLARRPRRKERRRLARCPRLGHSTKRPIVFLEKEQNHRRGKWANSTIEAVHFYLAIVLGRSIAKPIPRHQKLKSRLHARAESLRFPTKRRIVVRLNESKVWPMDLGGYIFPMSSGIQADSVPAPRLNQIIDAAWRTSFEDL